MVGKAEHEAFSPTAFAYKSTNFSPYNLQVTKVKYMQDARRLLGTRDVTEHVPSQIKFVPNFCLIRSTHYLNIDWWSLQKPSASPCDPVGNEANYIAQNHSLFFSHTRQKFPNDK